MKCTRLTHLQSFASVFSTVLVKLPTYALAQKGFFPLYQLQQELFTSPHTTTGPHLQYMYKYAGLAFGLPSSSSSEGEAGSKREKVLPPVEAGEASPIPTLRKFPRAAVASDGEQSLPSETRFVLNISICRSFTLTLTNGPGLPCATVAKDLLAEGGSAVDAAVGALVCNGLYNPQVSIF